MGISAIQHRIVTGRYYSISCVNRAGNRSAECDLTMNNILRLVTSVMGVLLYCYIICLLMAIFIETTLNENILLISKIHSTVKSNSLKDLPNIGIFIILNSIPTFSACKKSSIKKLFVLILSVCKSTNEPIIKYTLWVFALNLVLIVICHPTIVNPGPRQKLSVAYHNVQGFVPLNELGNPNPMLNTDKVLEFQSHLFHNKPDIVVLNETWLSKILMIVTFF